MRPVVTILTSSPRSATVVALANSCQHAGLTPVCGQSLAPRSALVFRWSLASARVARAVATICERRQIEVINAHVLNKWVQWRRLAAAEVPVPLSRRVRTVTEADDAALTIGYPVVLKPLAGLKSHGVVVVRDEEALARAWEPMHRLVQQYLPAGGRCARLLVVGDRVVHAVTRVARDGVRATYDHGRRASLEPFDLTPQAESIAVSACQALDLDIAGVDVVMTTEGPMVLEVNHRRVEFGDRALHGPGGVAAVATYLAHRAEQAIKGHPHRPVERKVVRIVTGLPRRPSVNLLLLACEREGLSTDIGSRTVAAADGLWFWGLTRRHLRREAQRARAMALPSINGVVVHAWEQRAALFRAGFHVPRSRPARTIAAATTECAALGYPITRRDIRDPAKPVTYVETEAQLEASWRDGDGYVVESARWEALPRVRIWVAADQVFRARRSRPDATPSVRWPLTRITDAMRQVAVGACRTLQIDIGVVDLAIDGGTLVVLRVLPRGVWLEALPSPQAQRAATALARTLHRRLLDVPASPATHQRAPRRLLIVAARDFTARGTGMKIAYIHALYRELLRQGHRIACLDGRFDRALVDDADFILQDPLQWFGFHPFGDEIDALLYEHAAVRAHLLRRLPHGTTDKPGMGRFAERLGVRTPAILPFQRVRAADLPVIVKPRIGSLGRGVRLARTLREVRARRDPRQCVQQFIDARAGAAVSIRAVTVVDIIVSAAVFYNTNGVCSNLSQGGRAIALTGVGRRASLTSYESALLARIGIDDIDRCVPAQVVAMAAAVGRHHATYGVQMLGQDFVVDANQQWYFLEVNMGFGTAVFNVTDGDGFPASGAGLRHAARLIGAVITERFGSRATVIQCATEACEA